MKTIQIKDLLIENRQRKQFTPERISSLALSIQKKGLMHPIVLRDDGRTLVAGGRRIKAIELGYELDISIQCDGDIVPLYSIPYILMSDLSDEGYREAELEENVLREDLTWQEKTEAIATLHSLRKEQNDGDQTFTATAREIKGDAAGSRDLTEVSSAILIQQYIGDEEVGKAKSAKEAMKIIKKKVTHEFNAVLATQFKAEGVDHDFFHGDFQCHEIATASVDVILTDPPYGIGADGFGSQADAAHGYKDDEKYFKKITESFLNESARVCKPQAHMYLFCNPRWFSYLSETAKAFGWDVWPTPLIWDKGNGMLPRPDHGPRRCYEMVLYAIRGNKEVNAVYPDVLRVPHLSNPMFGAEKPEELYLEILKRSVSPGSTVWDAFAGAGPIFPAANSLDVRVIASEMLADKYHYAKLRMEDKI